MEATNCPYCRRMDRLSLDKWFPLTVHRWLSIRTCCTVWWPIRRKCTISQWWRTAMVAICTLPPRNIHQCNHTIQCSQQQHHFHLHNYRHKHKRHQMHYKHQTQTVTRNEKFQKCKAALNQFTMEPTVWAMEMVLQTCTLSKSQPVCRRTQACMVTATTAVPVPIMAQMSTQRSSVKMSTMITDLTVKCTPTPSTSAFVLLPLIPLQTALCMMSTLKKCTFSFTFVFFCNTNFLNIYLEPNSAIGSMQTKVSTLAMPTMLLSVRRKIIFRWLFTRRHFKHRFM